MQHRDAVDRSKSMIFTLVQWESNIGTQLGVILFKHHVWEIGDIGVATSDHNDKTPKIGMYPSTKEIEEVKVVADYLDYNLDFDGCITGEGSHVRYPLSLVAASLEKFDGPLTLNKHGWLTIPYLEEGK